MQSNYEYPPTEFDPKPRRKLSIGTLNFRSVLFGLAALVLFTDHLTKEFISHHLPVGRAHTVIPGILRITHVLNFGAAFSMFADSTSPDTVRKVLILFSLFAILVISIMLWRVGRTLSLTSVALALILGGACGNLYDRLRWGSVLDFIEVHIHSYHWPDFNFADSCIVTGACLLLIEIFRPQPTEN
jgi:signal peptidase II